ncbi:MAG: hypothetical protein KatS3mg102_0879 [Planctomycetota bacterium]|nr:MAG: hypothetical protein KatS3mg102_0879 [Planctomycetota bacterium]
MASIKSLDRFVEQLERLAALGKEVKELGEAVEKHEASALAHLLERIKPVMEYIDGPITTREEWVASDNPRDKQTFYYKEPGIVLVNNFESTVRDAHGRMVYSGYKIIYTRSGKLVQLDRRGTWSEGEHDTFWSSEAHEIELTPELASRHLPECVASIVAAIERAVHTHRQRREELARRLRLLRAIARALETGRLPPEGGESGEMPMAGGKAAAG